MDEARALQKIVELQELVTVYSEKRFESGQPPYRAMILELLPVVTRIVAAVDPDLPNLMAQRPPTGTRGYEFTFVREALHRAKGLLDHQVELQEILGPQGPRLSADELHEWVWSAAASLWDGGHRRAAVQTAASVVDTHAKEKLERRDISGADLMMQAWAIDPPKKVALPRLRFAGLDPASEEYRSRHEGAKFFGAGCMMAIRNVASHDVEELEPQIALEHLAALSVLARWIEAADVVVQDPEG